MLTGKNVFRAFKATNYHIHILHFTASVPAVLPSVILFSGSLSGCQNALKPLRRLSKSQVIVHCDGLSIASE